MGATTRYYAVILLLVVFQTAFNVQLVIRYSSTKCYELEDTSTSRRLLRGANEPTYMQNSASQEQSLITDDGGNVDKTENWRMLQTTLVESSISLKTMPLILTVVYALISGLCLLSTLIVWCLSDRTSKNFASPNWFFRCFGFFLRVFAPLMTLLHLLAVIFIVVQFFFLYGGNTCLGNGKVANDAKVEDMIKDSKIVDIVTAIIWVVLHVLAPRIRSMLYIESFMYSPVDPDKNKVIELCCTTVGF